MPLLYRPLSRTTTYVSRGEIEHQVRRQLKSDGAAAIVSIYGPGGIGKTELVIRAAEELKPRYGPPIWIAVGDKSPAQVVSDLAAQCGIRFEANLSYGQQVAQVKHWLVNNPRLVVFDDVRLVFAGTLDDFLPPRPPCAVLITSRVRQLSSFIPADAIFELGQMTHDQALQLLMTELGQERVDSEPIAINALIERCKFNPLALNIAARRIALLKGFEQPVALLVGKLMERLAELKIEGGDQRLDLFVVFDLSYLGLSPEMQRCFRWLATFAPTGFSPDAASRVWGRSLDEVNRAVSLLVNVSLLRSVEGTTERYRLHDLLDEYAISKLGVAGEYAQAHRAHAHWLIDLLEKHSPYDPHSDSELMQELDNLRAAARWAMSEARDGELLAQLATWRRDRITYLELQLETDVWLESALTLGLDDQWLKARVLVSLGLRQSLHGKHDLALTSYKQALTLFREVADPLAEAEAYLGIGWLHQLDGEHDVALANYQQALTLYRTLHNLSGEAHVLGSIGHLLEKT